MRTESSPKPGFLGALIRFSTQNALLVAFVVLVTGAVGVRAMRALPIDAVPDVTNVQVQVLTTAPELGPLEVERFVTYPVESVMSGLPDLAELRSVTRFGLSAVTIVFDEGTDIYRARQLVEERLSAAREAIPEGYGSPQMGPISTGLGEIYMFEVSAEPMCDAGAPDTEACWSLMELRAVLDWDIGYQLRSVPGVVEVNSFGGELRTYEVEVDPDQLLSFRLSLAEVIEALERNNANAGGAYIAHAGEQRLIRGTGLLRSLREIEQVVISTQPDGTPIYMRDVGRVHFAPMVRQGAVTRDGRGEVVTGTVMMLMGENSRDVARAVDARIREIEGTLPEGVSIETYYDRTQLVDRTIMTVATNLLEGGVLVVVVLLLLLGSLRGGFLVASVIPLSMLGTFIVMKQMGVAGNLMSLGALDFGLIVDAPVVVVESIVRGRRSSGGATPAGVEASAREVARPVAFAVGIIMLVYVPILTLEGVEGKMFRPMALTVLVALAASLLLAVTLMPALSTVLFRGPSAGEGTRLMRIAHRLYDPVVRIALRYRRTVALLAFSSFLASLLLIPRLGAEFMPRLDEGAIAIQAVRLPSVSLEESVRATTRVEEVLLEHFGDEVLTAVSRTGRAEIATDPMGVEISDIYVMLRPRESWRYETQADLVAAMSERLQAEAIGQNFVFSQPIELRTNELVSGSRSDIAVSVFGDDFDELRRAGASVASLLGELDGAQDVSVEQVAGLPLLTIEANRDAIARYGADVRDVMRAVEAMGGSDAGEVFEGQRRFPLRVRIAEQRRSDPAAIRRIPVATEAGQLVPLGQVADVRTDEGPAQVSRASVRRRLTVQVNVRGRDLAGYVAEAQRRISSELELPDGYFVEWGGQFENLERATDRLVVVVPLVLASIFVLLYVNFRDVRPALLVFANVPIAATGGLVALVVRGMPFSISAAVGFIALFGIAVLNGVVMVSCIRDRQQHGESTDEACLEGAKLRLRPVLMTALTDVLGFFPMATSTTAGAEVQRPLATVVIGGLATCTVLTLLVLPALYAWLGGRAGKSTGSMRK